jgi:putative hydrolase of the HAD superfamily
MSRLAGRDVWVFDLDNTLYPAENTIYDSIGERMTAYIARLADVSAAEALALRERYFHQYGATLVGLVRHHGADAADFIASVHDVPVDVVPPDPELARLIGALPGRRFVFTNGGRDYARRILARLGVEGAFERVVAMEDVDLQPKPAPAAFRRLMALGGFEASRAVMFEDHLLNLETAAALGFATVLVGAETAPGPHIDFATPRLHPFLRTLAGPRIDRESAAP